LEGYTFKQLTSSWADLENSLIPYLGAERKRIKQKWALAMIGVFMAKALFIFYLHDAPSLKAGVTAN
jgi:hypothetical protein